MFFAKISFNSAVARIVIKNIFDVALNVSFPEKLFYGLLCNTYQ